MMEKLGETLAFELAVWAEFRHRHRNRIVGLCFEPDFRGAGDRLIDGLHDYEGRKRARSIFPWRVRRTFRQITNLGDRQIYAGKVKAITRQERILIPAAAADAILKTAGVYSGMKPKSAKPK